MATELTIEQYVKKNWAKLPKSTFNDDVIVLVKVLNDSDEGWGNHSYAGIGVDANGKKWWCYSSGCSCSGTCGMDEVSRQTIKNESDYDLSEIDPVELNFDSLQKSFADYE